MSKFTNQLMIALLLGLLAAGYFWAEKTQLDLITRGEGRLIAEGQNKLVQAPDGGIVTQILVKEGDIVTNNQLLAVINPTAAEGSLEEIKAKKNKLMPLNQTMNLAKLKKLLKNIK